MIRATVILTLALCGADGASAQQTTTGSGAIVRVLDRVNGTTQDHEMKSGSSFEASKLLVTLKECRYPRRRLNRDAFAHLVVTDTRQEEPAFDGWMVASSPALSALEHPRYDVWVIKCLAP